MARYDCNNEKKKIANDLIYPHDGFGDAYLTGVFTGSDFEMTTILHVFSTFFVDMGLVVFALAWPT